MENTCTPNIKSSYTYEDLLASGRGELFGKEGPQLPDRKSTRLNSSHPSSSRMPSSA